MRISLWFFLALVAGAAAPALALDQDAQLWLSAAADIGLRDGIELQLESNQRIGDDDGGLYESEYLAALAFRIAPGVTLTGGVVRVIGLSGGRVQNTEWRPRQQISFPLARIGHGQLTARIGLEQRFRHGANGTGHRARPKLTYALPLGEGLKLALAHESYFNLNSTRFQRSGHERMRNSATLSAPITGRLSADLGYLNQYRFTTNRMEHALTMGLAASF